MQTQNKDTKKTKTVNVWRATWQRIIERANKNRRSPAAELDAIIAELEEGKPNARNEAESN